MTIRHGRGATGSGSRHPAIPTWDVAGSCRSASEPTAAQAAIQLGTNLVDRARHNPGSAAIVAAVGLIRTDAIGWIRHAARASVSALADAGRTASPAPGGPPPVRPRRVAF